MASHGIKDRVAIVGMGCTNFVEHWDKGLDDLVIEAANEAYASAGIDKDDVDAYWLGTAQGGMSGITLATPVAAGRQAGHPGRELLRHRRRVTAPGRRTRWRRARTTSRWRSASRRPRTAASRGSTRCRRRTTAPRRTLTAAAMFSMVAPAYAAKYGVDADKMREAMAHVAWKNHHNGARNSRAQFRREVSIETICNSPKMAGDLRRVRLRGRRRRLGGRHRRAGRGRLRVHRHAASS